MKKSLLITTIATISLVLAGCGGKTSSSSSSVSSSSSTTVITAKVGQGVTDTTILVGNTATEGGTYGFIGFPFNAGLRAYLEEVNDAGGIGGRTISLKNRDDGFNGATGLANTEQLVEEDKVFALVGHFGTPTIAATINYMKETGVPMVYAATGDNSLYQLKAASNARNIMPVQPIYKTEGRLLLARVMAETDLFGTATKVGIIYSNDSAGTSIKAGLDEEVSLLGISAKVVYAAIAADGSDAATAIQKLKAEGVSSVIVAANQAPFKATYSAMNAQSLNVPVITSYVNADITAVPADDYNAARPIYANAWVDVFSEKGAADTVTFGKAIANASFLTDAQKTAYAVNSYAIAGYIAAHVFCSGLKAVAGKTGNEGVLNWENYINAMEEVGQISIPMGGTVDFSDGKRWGIDSMSVLKYAPAAGTTAATFAKVKEIETLTAVTAKIK